MNSKQPLNAEEQEVFNYYLGLMEDCPTCKNKDNVLMYVVGKPGSILNDLAFKTKRIRLNSSIVDKGELKKFVCSKCQTKFN